MCSNNPSMKKAQLIDLTNLDDNAQRRENLSQIKLQILDDGSSVKPPVFYKSNSNLDDNKENRDPSAGCHTESRFKRNKSAS